jgi:anti-sigma factor RsiW
MGWREDLRCDDVRDRLEALVDGELGSAERDAVEAHCGFCAACGRERARAEALRGALRGLPELEPPAGLLERVRAAATGEPAPQWRRWWRARPALAAAAVVLVAAGAVLIRATVRPAPEPHLIRARAEARYAFALVADTCRRAGGVTRRAVFLKRIVAPSAGALHRALPGRLTAGGGGLRPSPVNGG